MLAMEFGDVSKFPSPFSVAKFSSIYSLRSSLFIKRESLLRLHKHMSSPSLPPWRVLYLKRTSQKF
jgi:hypothetical protein